MIGMWTYLRLFEVRAWRARRPSAKSRSGGKPFLMRTQNWHSET